MDWDGREVVTAGCLKGRGMEAGVLLELFVDDGLNPALGTKLGQEFTEDAIAESMNLLDLPPEP